LGLFAPALLVASELFGLAAASAEAEGSVGAAGSGSTQCIS